MNVWKLNKLKEAKKVNKLTWQDQIKTNKAMINKHEVGINLDMTFQLPIVLEDFISNLMKGNPFENQKIYQSIKKVFTYK
jgi:hypothetical protein